MVFYRYFRSFRNGAHFISGEHEKSRSFFWLPNDFFKKHPYTNLFPVNKTPKHPSNFLIKNKRAITFFPKIPSKQPRIFKCCDTYIFQTIIYRGYSVHMDMFRCVRTVRHVTYVPRIHTRRKTNDNWIDRGAARRASCFFFPPRNRALLSARACALTKPLDWRQPALRHGVTVAVPPGGTWSLKIEFFSYFTVEVITGVLRIIKNWKTLERLFR